MGAIQTEVVEFRDAAAEILPINVENTSIVKIRITPNSVNAFDKDATNSTATATIRVTKPNSEYIQSPEKKIELKISNAAKFKAPIVTLRIKRLRS